MRVFVSLIVWLFSVTGTDGFLTVKPSHMIAMKSTSVTFTCTSGRPLSKWFQFKYPEGSRVLIVGENCDNQDKNNFDVSSFKDRSQDLYRCDLIVKPAAQVYSDGLTTSFICEDYFDENNKEDTIYAILLHLESPLKCEERERVLFCTLRYSAYRNITQMFQYLDIKLEMKNPTGKVVASKSAGLMDNAVVISVQLDGGKPVSSTKPYTCTASFTRHCDDNNLEQCATEIIIQLPSATKCKYSDSYRATTTKVTFEAIETVPAKKFFAKYRAMGTIIPIVTTTSSEDINAEDPEGGLLAAKAVERRTTTTRFRVSNARLERDGVDSFVMLTSLLVAFLVQ